MGLHIQDTKGYKLSIQQQIDGLMKTIIHLQEQLGHTLPLEHPFCKKLSELHVQQVIEMSEKQEES